jgi:hypothetical protein
MEKNFDELIGILSELEIILNGIASIFIECVVDSGVDELILDSEIGAQTQTLSAITPHINDKVDNEYEVEISRISLFFEKARPLLKRLGKVNVVPGSSTKVGDFKKSSVASLAFYIKALNSVVALLNEGENFVDASKRNEVKLLQATKDACNAIIVPVNEVITEQNSYFEDDKSMQVDLVNLVV